MAERHGGIRVKAAWLSSARSVRRLRRIRRDLAVARRVRDEARRPPLWSRGYNSPGFLHLHGVRHSSDRTDAELVHAAESDAGAFGELYKRHVSTVHGWFRRRLEWAASDLTAETFAQAWLSRRSFRNEADGSALPWLLGSARNVARESARRNEVETRARSRLGRSEEHTSELQS